MLNGRKLQISVASQFSIFLAHRGPQSYRVPQSLGRPHLCGSLKLCGTLWPIFQHLTFNIQYLFQLLIIDSSYIPSVFSLKFLPSNSISDHISHCLFRIPPERKVQTFLRIHYEIFYVILLI